ncbi:MAG: nucleoside hydrolase [Sandaracinaceae bacterium]
MRRPPLPSPCALMYLFAVFALLGCEDMDGPDAGPHDAGSEDAGAFEEIAWPALDADQREARLARTEGAIDVVIDADLGNEIDDQFAVVQALLAPERLRVQALYAAPWSLSPELFASPAFTSALDARLLREDLAARGVNIEDIPIIEPRTGARRAALIAAEITDLLDRADVPVFGGAGHYLGTDPRAPVTSAASADLITRAREERDGPLYVLCLGALTDVASALLLAPDLVERIVVVWASAYPTFWPYPNGSYNLAQDIPAADVVLESGVPFVYVPGYFVAEELRVTRPEMDAHLGEGPVARFLFDLYDGHPLDGDHYAGRSKVLWDMAVIGWALDPNWFESRLVTTPTLDSDVRWVADADGVAMREVLDVSRDALMRDFLERVRDR